MKAKWKNPAPLSESIFALFPAVVADAPQWTADDTKVDPTPMKPLTNEERKELQQEMSNLSFISDEEDNGDDDCGRGGEEEMVATEEEELRLTIELPGEFYELGAEVGVRQAVGVF